MTILGYNSNSASLGILRELSLTTGRLQQSFERLSSGLRINRASDDAAGLELSDKLNTNSRLFSQALRNTNDGISLLNAAESSVSEFSSILSRLKELATQASNGTLTRVQRLALDEEALALRDEFNRIVNSTEFNGMSLLDGGVDQYDLQVGIDSQGQLSIEVSDNLDRLIGDATFQDLASFSTTTSTNTAFMTADFNNDGHQDIVTVSNSGTELNVLLGNGDGTFQAAVSYDTFTGSVAVSVGDFNNDGILDLVTAEWVSNSVGILLGNGDGTFQAYSLVASVSYNVIGQVATADMNGDGNMDIITAGGDNAVGVLLGNGDGTFQARATYSAANIRTLSIGDINNDGILDVVAGNSDSSDSVYVFLGNGNGTLSSGVTYLGGALVSDITLADVNYDGILDIITAGNIDDTVNVLLGNGDGTFKTRSSFAGGDGATSVVVADMNGDGIDDLVTYSTADDSVNLLLGNGDGTFQSLVSFGALNAIGNPQTAAVADLDEDGVLDIISLGDAAVAIHLANTTEVTTLPRLNLTTEAKALESIQVIDDAEQRVLSELGSLGGQQSRLSNTVSHLSILRDQFDIAKSRIVDADIASEVAQMIRNQVLQQAGIAVLAQANQQGAVALSLLGLT